MNPTFNDMSADSLDELVDRIAEARDYNLALSSEDNQLIIEGLSTLSILQEKLADNDITLHKLKKMLGMIASSEKHKDDHGTRDEAQGGDAIEAAKDEARKELKAKSRADKKRAKQKKNKTATPTLKPNTEHHALTGLKKGDTCSDCHQGKFYKYAPAQLLRITGHSPFTPTVHLSERVRCNACGIFKTAALPDSVKGDGDSDQKYGFSARSIMAINKYFAGSPFNRQESLQQLLGVSITASTIFDQCEHLGNDLFPVFELMLKVAANAQGFQIDDTTHRILDQKPIEKPQRNGTTMRMRSGVYTSGMIAALEGGQECVVFKTNIGHSGEFIDEVLANRQSHLAPPLIMSDALSSNRPTVLSEGQFTPCLCNAHARRQYFDVLSSFPVEVDFVLKKYKHVWLNEDEIEEKQLTRHERLVYHQEHSLPVMETIRSWGNKLLESEEVEENSGLGKAIRYFAKHYEGLTAFCRVEGALIDNNVMEGQLKLIARGRKNAYFFKTLAGASIADVITSMIASAAKSGINVFEYFNALQRNSAQVKVDPEPWLPWNFKA